MQYSTVYPTFFLAIRLLCHLPRRGTLGALLRIALISIVLASGAFLLVGAVMEGFHRATVRSLQGMRAPCTLLPPRGRSLDFNAVMKMLLEIDNPYRVMVLPRSELAALIKNREGIIDITSPVICMGIDPQRECEGNILTRFTDPAVIRSLSNRGIILGARRCEVEGYAIGDMVTLAYPDDERSKDGLLTREVTIEGVIKTGLYELDEHLVLMEHHLFEELTGHEWPDEIGLVSQDGVDAEKISAFYDKKVAPLQIISWQSLYPALAAALALEHLAMGAILFLMCSLAALTIAALMFVVIREQHPLIAMLVASGVSRKLIVRALTIFGMVLVGLSTLLGLLLGAGIAWSVDYYALIPLPDVYYATHLPAVVTGKLIFGTFLIVMIIGWFATYMPARRAYDISCATILREEF